VQDAQEKKTLTIGQHLGGTLSYILTRSRRRDKWDTILKVIFLVLQLADLVLTALAARYGWTELNPMMQSSLNSISKLAFLKFSIPVLISWFVPGRWLIPAILLLCMIVGWNVTQILMLVL
jgi:hypothetical protein